LDGKIHDVSVSLLCSLLHTNLIFEGITAAIGTNLGFVGGENFKTLFYNYEPNIAGMAE
jgi:hypothetical protein